MVACKPAHTTSPYFTIGHDLSLRDQLHSWRRYSQKRSLPTVCRIEPIAPLSAYLLRLISYPLIRLPTDSGHYGVIFN